MGNVYPNLKLFWLYRQVAITVLLSIFLVASSRAQNTSDLTKKSLEDLMNLEVTSVSKKKQKTSQAAAAVFVISDEDIRRSGALNIPDLLRMVPGLDVAQLNSTKWAISARGFNGQFANKLLVLIDGRTVYTPLFAGVYWDSQNVPLSSIQRIEVIRGPGAAVWGSNAVNGVINIITKPATETQGGLVQASGGDSVWGPEEVRYGAKLGSRISYRIYGQGAQYGASPSAGFPAEDDWRIYDAGFRADTKLSARESLITEAEGYQGNAGEVAEAPVSLLPPETESLALRDRYSGWNLLNRWNRTLSSGSDVSFQVYFDRIVRGDSTYGIADDTFDAEFQHHFTWGARQDIVWGLGYRISSDATTPKLRIAFTPQDKRLQLFSGFAQDEVILRPRSLSVSLSARLEHNDYTGFDLQPSIRAVWRKNSRCMFWGAASAADRIPSRSDTEIRVNYAAIPGPGGEPALVSLLGNRNQKNERLTAFEAGYRNTWTGQLSTDLTVFYDRYRDLMSIEPGTPRLETTPPPAHVLIPSYFGNGYYGETHGLEVFANWSPTGFWSLSPSYTFFAMHLHSFAGSHDTTTGQSTEGSTPDHQAQLRSNLKLPRHLLWSTSAYFVNRLPALAIPSYTRLDTNLTWQTGERIVFSLVGQNLLRDRHLEYSGPDSSVQSNMVGRGGYLKVVWSF